MTDAEGQKLNVSDECHRALKSYCKRNGIRMKALVERLIMEEIGNATVEKKLHIRGKAGGVTHAAISGPPFWETSDDG